METRIIDLIKNPETLRVEDLSLLETEIEKFPYMQSLRAIYLLGVHRFYNENFSKELAKTAAYTTDKRILYNLINKTNENMAAALAASAFPFKTDLATKTPKIQEVKTEAIPAPAEVKIEEKTDLVTEKQSVEISEPVSFVEENKNEEQQAVNIETPSIPDVSLVEEPQSDVLSPEKTETEKTELTAAEYIAAEMAKLKAGAATEEPAIAEKEENIETTETIEIISEAEKEERETTIDFYARKQTSFVEETPAQKEDFYSAKTTSESSTENEERETTIDFYARKQTSFVEETPAQKEDFYSAKTTSESSTENEERETTIDFYARKQTSFVEETPAQKEDFYSAKTTSESSAEKEERETTTDFYASKKADSDAQEEQTSYSPVNIYQKQIDTEKEDTAEVSKNPVQEENISTTEEAANSEKPEPKAEETEKVSEVVKPTSNSNVTSFISTWKSWLKIDRSEIVTPSEQDKKAAIIDKFIENNPKISPIKEDVDFIVKEKSNDISHLMTETLAQLYVEQKLYTKAIQAYKILQEKHPEKTEEFEERIEEIKKSRNIK